MNEPLGLAAVAAGGTSYTAIGVVASIFVPICAAVAIVLWNYYRATTRAGTGPPQPDAAAAGRSRSSG